MCMLDGALRFALAFVSGFDFSGELLHQLAAIRGVARSVQRRLERVFVTRFFVLMLLRDLPVTFDLHG